MEEARRDARLSGGLGYRPALDGLRGISILAVMAYHSGLVTGGFLGVDVFFALSGFLITTLLLAERERTGAIALGRFYARRALRLLPALVALLAVCAPLMLALAPPQKAEHTGAAVVVVLFYTANWALLLGQPLYVFNHAWSLAIEEQFYLLWPLAVIALARAWRRRPLLWAMGLGAVVAGIPVYRVLSREAGASLSRLYLGLDTRADSLLVGCAAAVLMTWRPLPAAGRAARILDGMALVAGLGLLALFVGATWPESFLRIAASTLAATAAAVFIAGLLRPGSPLAPPVEAAALVGIGRISYGLYLWHFPIFFALDVLRVDGTVADGWLVAVAWAATLAVAALSFYVVERPLLRLKTHVSA